MKEDLAGGMRRYLDEGLGFNSRERPNMDRT